uniref:Taste receptor type 1 member 1-like n=1 Tax=Gouania willdenowi TaxID=441366 RepID=A0A8C5GXX0_GOUWI
IMKHFLLSLFFVEFLLRASTASTFSDSDFHQDGDYLIGGLFNLHAVGSSYHHHRPEAINCSHNPLVLANYRRFQLMRFSVEEVNNSSTLLPNVSLGYEIFDHCSQSHNFPDIFQFMSVNGMIRPWAKAGESSVIAVVGPFTSSQTWSVAPLLMMDLIPVVSYASTSSDFSEQSKFPAFLRTIPPNKDTIEAIFNVLQHFDWRWVAFLNGDNDFGIDGLELFRKKIYETDICLAYSKGLGDNPDYKQIFNQIEAQNVHIIIVFAPKIYAEALINSAIQLNVTNKVWIADDGWSLDKKLPKMKGIHNIGTILGVSQPLVTIAGFNDFILTSKGPPVCGVQHRLCNQVCNCRGFSAEQVSTEDPLFSFPVYSAVYAIAHALHNTLQCGTGRCNNNITAYPHKVLAEMKKSNFTLLNHTVQFDENGDPRFGSYSIVFWNRSGDAQEVGFSHFYPRVYSYIYDTKIQWHKSGKVPDSYCSPECPVGYAKKQSGIHKCCFTCVICQNGTYINTTEDPYTCKACSDTEWSPEGSTRCNLRLVEYVPFTDPAALGLMVISGLLVVLTLAVCVLFAFHYNTPVVRSAGGSMCFLILGCLSLSSISVFFYFGKPSVAFCIFRFLPFLLFYTVCVSCFVVRSFQIVCIFKIAAKFPKLQSWWMKYHGQWVVISVAFVIQALLLLIGYSSDPPKPHNETFWYLDKIILGCDINLKATSTSVIFLLTLCILCFIFSYMGKDLPKNYNEAKSITFCLMLLILTWVIFATEYMLYHGRHIVTLNALAVLFSLYLFIFWYFLPKCYIIMFQPDKNTQQYFQGLIQSYTKTISQ